MANGASESACFFFERANGELGTGLTVAQILADPLFETATAFALRDVHEIVQEQFAIAPGIGANDDGIAEAYAPCIVGDYAGASRRLRQFRIVWQRNAIDNQHAHAGTIPNASPARILRLPWGQGSAAGKDEVFLCFRPLISEWQKVFECFLIDHGRELRIKN